MINELHQGNSLLKIHRLPNKVCEILVLSTFMFKWLEIYVLKQKSFVL